MNSRSQFSAFTLVLAIIFGVASCAPMQTIKSTPPSSAEEKPGRAGAEEKPSRTRTAEKPSRTSTAEKPARDPFFRIYAVPFKDFHPRVHQALQKFAQEKPGSSFQVARLGSDGVYFRGFLQRENKTRLSVSIVTRPEGPKKTSLQIKPSSAGEITSEAAAASSDLFQVIENETGFKPAE